MNVFVSIIEMLINILRRKKTADQLDIVSYFQTKKMFNKIWM